MVCTTATCQKHFCKNTHSMLQMQTDTHLYIYFSLANITVSIVPFQKSFKILDIAWYYPMILAIFLALTTYVAYVALIHCIGHGTWWAAASGQLLGPQHHPKRTGTIRGIRNPMPSTETNRKQTDTRRIPMESAMVWLPSLAIYASPYGSYMATVHHGTASQSCPDLRQRAKGSSLMSGLKRSIWSCRMPASVAGYLKHLKLTMDQWIEVCPLWSRSWSWNKVARVGKSLVSRCFKTFQDVSNPSSYKAQKDQPSTPQGHSAAKSSLSGCEDSPECHRAIISSHLADRDDTSRRNTSRHDTSVSSRRLLAVVVERLLLILWEPMFFRKSLPYASDSIQSLMAKQMTVHHWSYLDVELCV